MTAAHSINQQRIRRLARKFLKGRRAHSKLFKEVKRTLQRCIHVLRFNCRDMP